MSDNKLQDRELQIELARLQTGGQLIGTMCITFYVLGIPLFIESIDIPGLSKEIKFYTGILLLLLAGFYSFRVKYSINNKIDKIRLEFVNNIKNKNVSLKYASEESHKATIKDVNNSISFYRCLMLSFKNISIKKVYNIISLFLFLGNLILIFFPRYGIIYSFDSNKFNDNIPYNFTKEFIMFRLETLQNTILFYAILFFTCVVGIIELLPGIENTNNGLQSLLLLLYFSMVAVIDFCIFRVWGVFLESALLTRIELTGWEAYKNYAITFSSIFDDLILNPLCSKLLVSILIIVVTLLFNLIYRTKYFLNNVDTN